MNIDLPELEQYAVRLRELIAEAKGSDPELLGVPLGWIHLDFQPLLDQLVKRGEFEIVGRPARVNPMRTAWFVREKS